MNKFTEIIMEMERIIRRDLNQAAIAGDVNTFVELLQQDPLLLDRIMVDSTLGAVEENPLHIVALLGHLNFLKEILNRKPELTRELNSSHGSSPLHLASAKGHLEIVRELIRLDEDLCLIRDHEGRIPLHIAVIKGKVEVMNEVIQTKPDLTHELTGRGETVLHLCVKYNQYDAMIKIMEEGDEELLKAKDGDGNTVLHLAVARRQIQMLKMLLSCDKVEVNTLNGHGLTALDVLLQCPAQSGDLEIGEMLRNAGALRDSTANTCTRIGNSQGSIHNENLSKMNKKKKKNKKADAGGPDVNTLMVVAILIATMTFEAALNPPGGDCAKFNANCTFTDEYKMGNVTVGYSYTSLNYSMFLLVDMIGFLSSLSVIVLIISGLHFSGRYNWVLMVIMMLAIASVALLFSFWITAIKPKDSIILPDIPIFWLGLIALIGLWQFVRFVIWSLKKCGLVKVKPQDTTSTARTRRS